MLERYIAESTECDFKVALEVARPKSWLKSVSAFANGIGGTLFFGVADDHTVVGLLDAVPSVTVSRRCRSSNLFLCRRRAKTCCFWSWMPGGPRRIITRLTA